MRGDKGITLVALIITIIVLLILAGVTIAMLMGDHGILTQADDSKVTTIEGTVKEKVYLAVNYVRLAIANKAAINGAYDATADNCGDVVTWLREDAYLGHTDDWTISSASDNVITVTYKGNDYKQAKKINDAVIVYRITVDTQSLSIAGPATE